VQHQVKPSRAGLHQCVVEFDTIKAIDFHLMGNGGPTVHSHPPGHDAPSRFGAAERIVFGDEAIQLQIPVAGCCWEMQ